MNSIGVVCTAYFYRSNPDLIMSAKRVSSQVIERLTELARLSEDIIRSLSKLGEKKGLEVLVSRGYSIIADREVRVSCLLVGEDLKEIEYIFRPIFIGLGSLGLERPTINVFAFYHPPVKISIDDITGWVLPQGLTLREVVKAREEGRIHVNIYNINLELIRQVVEAIVGASLYEKAISRPSERAIENYTEKVLRELSKREQNQLLIGFNEIVEGLREKLEDISRELSTKLGDKVSRTEKLVDLMVSMMD